MHYVQHAGHRARSYLPQRLALGQLRPGDQRIRSGWMDNGWHCCDGGRLLRCWHLACVGHRHLPHEEKE